MFCACVYETFRFVCMLVSLYRNIVKYICIVIGTEEVYDAKIWSVYRQKELRNRETKHDSIER